MIIELILALFITTAFTSIVSGGFIFTMYYSRILILCLVGILAIFLIISERGKAFCKIFVNSKKHPVKNLTQLREIDNALDFACKTVLYVGLLFTVIALSYFYLNFYEMQTLGFNLAAVFCAIFHTLSIETIFLCLKSKNKKNMILFMAEESEETVDTSAKELEAEKKSSKSIWKIGKIFVAVLLIIGILWITVIAETRNVSKYNLLSQFFDLLSFVQLFVPSFLLLLISGNFKLFFQSFNFNKRENLSVTEKNLYLNAISTFRGISTLIAFSSALIGVTCTMQYLDQKEYLGINIYISLVPVFYALIINLIILPFEAKISKTSKTN